MESLINKPQIEIFSENNTIPRFRLLFLFLFLKERQSFPIFKKLHYFRNFG